LLNNSSGPAFQEPTPPNTHASWQAALWTRLKRGVLVRIVRRSVNRPVRPAATTLGEVGPELAFERVIFEHPKSAGVRPGALGRRRNVENQLD
jgi:hypothetical protein